MADEAAVIDSPIDVDSAVDTTADTSVGTGAGEETPELTAAPGTPPAPGAEEAKFQGPLFTVDGKATKGLQNVLQKLRSESPAVESRVRKALYANDSFTREFPGGVTEVREKIASLENAIEELGGADTVKQSLSQLQEYNQIVDRFAAGDPRFVDDLTAGPEDQDAYVKVAPSLMSKWSELHPEGHSHYVCSAIMSHANANGVPVALELLSHYLGNVGQDGKVTIDQSVLDQVNRIKGWFGSISQTGMKQPAAPAARAKPAAADDGSAALATRENNLVRSEFSQAALGSFRTVFSAEWGRQVAPLKLTAEQQASAKELFASRMKAKINNNPEIKRNQTRYLAAKDQGGYAKYMKGVYERETPGILRSIVAAFPSPGKRAATPPPAPGSPKPGAKPMPRATEGHQVVAKWPPDNIDLRQTTSTMFQQGKAILTDGRRVQKRG